MKTLIRNAIIVNEGEIFPGSIVVEDDKIVEIVKDKKTEVKTERIIDANGKYLFPGVIDDQVHFREPGLTHKGDIYTESKAAVAGGVTSFMEMPNTQPPVLTQELLEQKYSIAAAHSLANYSFYMGASNDNIGEILKTDPRKVCGIKIFMGSSTGNMLVNNSDTLEKIFSQCKMLIATHCEDEATIRANCELFKSKHGDNVPIEYHPLIRSEEACYRSSSFAVELASKYNTRLHILHISTAKELVLFNNKIPLTEKRITAEACIHHLWFSSKDYQTKDSLIKWNPAIKSKHDRDAVFDGVLSNRIDVIATDHAPHTLEEKQKPYFQCPSGGPMIQHSLVAMLELYHRKKILLEKIAEKMCHAPAVCFRLQKRGFIRKGYYADLVLVDMNAPQTVEKSNLLYKCKWSPFEGQQFTARVTHTFVNGNLIYENGNFHEDSKGMRLEFSE